MQAIAGKVLSGFLLRDNTALPRTPSRSITARELGVSPKTIEKHRSNLMRKLQLHNTAAVTMYAITNGVAANDPPGVHVATQLTALA